MEQAHENKHNAAVYQDKRRQETYGKIDEAIHYLRETQRKVTKVAIAEAAGINAQTLQKPHVKGFLLQYPEFNKELTAQDPPEVQIQKLSNEVQKLKSTLQQLSDRNKQLTVQNDKLKERNRKVEKQYEFLLDAYQRNIDSKFITM